MMSSPLPPSAARFAEAAAARGLSPSILVKATPARSAEEAAVACGCDVAQIVKSLVFRGERTGAPLLYLVCGRNRLDGARAEAAAGEPVGRADAETVRAVTGFAIGGIPPFGHRQAVRTFMDPDLLAFPVVWAAAGHPNAVFAIDPRRLREIAAATMLAP